MDSRDEVDARMHRAQQAALRLCPDPVEAEDVPDLATPRLRARPIDTSQLGPITCLPDAADELAKAVDAIQAAEGALCRAQAIVATDTERAALELELRALRAQRQRILVLRGGSKAEPVHFVGTAWPA